MLFQYLPTFHVAFAHSLYFRWGEYVQQIWKLISRYVGTCMHKQWTKIAHKIYNTMLDVCAQDIISEYLMSFMDFAAKVF